MQCTNAKMFCYLRDVCVRMQAKDLWCVYMRKMVNCLPEQLNRLALWDAVALVEGKGLQEHVLTKPHLGTPCVYTMNARLGYPIAHVRTFLVKY